MIFRRATATVLISMGVAAAFLQACSASPGTGETTGRTGSGTGNGTGSGTGGSTGTGGATGGGAATTGTGGGGPPPINPGNPEAGADIRLMEDASCAGLESTGEKKPTDLLMMIDSSGSMDTVDPGQMSSRWVNLTQAIPPFVTDMANAGMMIGLDFFPEGSGNQAICNVGNYGNPDVAIDLIPGMNGMHAAAISTAIMGRMPANGTPTVPALTGALTTAKAWQILHPERSINVLFMTDGEPQGCNNNNVNAAAAVASMYSNGMPPIKTYVLGVGPATGPLDTIAAGGGTTKAYMVTSGGAAELTKALADIRTSTLACDYNVPRGDAGMVDTGKIVVQVKIGANGTATDIPNVVNANGCAGNPMNPMGLGWYYDPAPPATPTKIVICPNSCGPLQMTDGSGVIVKLGCVPKIIPPPN